jgi:acetyl esterase/lipase
MAKRALPAILRASIRPLWASKMPVPAMRRLTEGLLRYGLLPRAARISATTLGGRSCELITPAVGASEQVLFYVHGGGYVACSPRTHRPLTSRLCVALNATSYVPTYRLAPEHPYPAGLDDVHQSYLALMKKGVSSEHITLIGDSAGGGMALALAVRLRDRGEPLPARMVLISPWVDLTLQGESLQAKADSDPMLSLPWIYAKTPLYLASTRADDPGVSPLFADLSGLPPTLVQVGTEEILLSDSERLKQRADASAWPLQLTVWDGMWHDFQMFADILPEANAAIAAIAKFVDSTK